MKTNKHLTLRLVEKKGGVHAQDVVRQFQYSPGTARSYLSYLARQDLLQQTGGGYCLTEKGSERLQYMDVAGCSAPACPLCEGKVTHFTCPLCGYSLPRKEARLRPARDFLLVSKPAGVHCPLCLSQILPEEQARLVGIRKEKK